MSIAELLSRNGLRRSAMRKPTEHLLSSAPEPVSAKPVQMVRSELKRREARPLSARRVGMASIEPSATSRRVGLGFVPSPAARRDLG